MDHYLEFNFYIGILVYQLLLEQELTVRRGLHFGLSFPEVILEKDSTKITKKTPFVQVNFSQSPENRDIHVYYYRPLLILESSYKWKKCRHQLVQELAGYEILVTISKVLSFSPYSLQCIAWILYKWAGIFSHLHWKSIPSWETRSTLLNKKKQSKKDVIFIFELHRSHHSIHTLVGWMGTNPKNQNT